MENKIYDYRAFVDVLIETRRPHIHEDFTLYYNTLLESLEALFKIKLSDVTKVSGTPNLPLASLFKNTLQSFLGIHHPLASYLEATLIHVRLDELGVLGEQVHQNLREADRLMQQTQQTLRQILYDLFEGIYGPTVLTFTSQDLLDMGFGDKEPNKIDYLDYL
jgi:hypothetical protein